MEAIQKFLWMFSTPPRLVFVQHNGVVPCKCSRKIPKNLLN